VDARVHHQPCEHDDEDDRGPPTAAHREDGEAETQRDLDHPVPRRRLAATETEHEER